MSALRPLLPVLWLIHGLIASPGANSAAARLGATVMANTVQENRETGNLELHLEFPPDPQQLEASVILAVPAGPLPTAEMGEKSVAPLIGRDLLTNDAQISTSPLSDPILVRELGQVRQHRLVRVVLPRRVAGSADGRVTSAVLKIRHHQPLPTPAPLRPGERTGPIHANLKKLVVNPGQLEPFAVPFPEMTGDLRPHPWTPQAFPWAMKIRTTTNSLHRIPAGSLLEANPQIANCPRGDLRLLANGKVIPIHDPSGLPKDQPLLQSDQILFVGQENTSPFSRESIYWLVPDPTQALLGMNQQPDPKGDPSSPVITTTPHEHVQEVDSRLVTRTDQFLSILDYRWIWKHLETGVPQEFTLNLPHAATVTSAALPLPGTLSLFVADWPSGAAPVHIQVQFPGEPPQSVPVSNAGQDIHGILIPTRELGAGKPTTFTVTLIGPTSGGPEIYLDQVRVTYSRVLQFDPGDSAFKFVSHSPNSESTSQTIHYRISGWAGSDPIVLASTPNDLTLLAAQIDPNGRYLSFGNLETTSTRYEIHRLSQIPVPVMKLWNPTEDLRTKGTVGDLLMVEHEPLQEAMTPLVQRWQAEGHLIHRVRVEDIYDQFSAGELTPHAIRQYLAWHMRHGLGSSQGPAASTVVFVGDCTSAFRNEFRNQITNQVPSYPHHGTSFRNDRFASDSWMVLTSGADELADAILGRFSLNNPRDIANAVQKTLVDRDAPLGPQHNTVAFVSDHSEFEEATNRLIGSIPVGRFLKRLQLSDEPWVDNFYFPKEIADAKKAKVSPATTGRIREIFHQGPRLFTFLGHGSPNIWSTERIWFGGDSDNSDNLSLHHPGRHPILINMTCNSGAIDYPMPRWNVAISEDFLRQRDGGPVACYVPSGPGTTSQHEKLTRELLRSFLEDGAPTVGSAIHLAMLRYQGSGNPEDLPRMFLLLGDPLIPTRFPQAPPANTPPPPGSFHQAIALDGIEVFRSTNITSQAGELALPPGIPTQRPSEPLLREWVGYSPETGQRTSASQPSPEGSPLKLRLAPDQMPLVSTPGKEILVSTILHLPGRPGMKMPLTQVEIPPIGLLDEKGHVLIQWAPQKPLPGALEAGTSLRLVWRGTAPSPGLYQVSPLTAQGLPQPPSERTGYAARPLLVRASQSTSDSILAIPTDGFAQIAPSAVGLMASVRVLVANPSGQNRNVTLQLINGHNSLPWTDSLTTASDLAPGEVRSILLPIPAISNLDSTATARVRWSSGDGAPPRVSARAVVAGRQALPDLRLTTENILMTPMHPTDGQTIFFDAFVENRGVVPAHQVLLEGSDITNTTTPLPMTSRINRFEIVPITIDPGTSRILRLRWDPFANAGQRTLRLAVRPGTINGDRNPEDNTVEIPLKVRTKHKLRRGPVAVLPPRPEDIEARQLRFIARIINEGETEAQSVRVTFYATPQRISANRLGEVMLDVVPPGNTDAILTYSLKPGEETRQFTPSVDAVQRGSSQRLLSAPTAP